MIIWWRWWDDSPPDECRVLTPAQMKEAGIMPKLKVLPTLGNQLKLWIGKP